MGQLTTWIILFSFILTGGLVVVIILFSLRRFHETEEQRRQAQLALGFTPQPKVPPELEARLISLYTTRFQKQLRLEHIASRRSPAGENFIFDLWDTSGDSSTQLANMGVAIVSPDLALPRFSLYPRPQVGGLLGGLAERVMTWAVSQNGQTVDFSHHPGFTSRYVVTADDPAAVQTRFTPPLLNRLANLQAISIVAGGDTLAVAQTPYPPRSGPPDIGELRQSLSTAEALYRMLSDYTGPAAQPAPATAALACPQCGAQLPPAARGTGIARCTYCGQETLLWAEQPPTGASPGAAARTAPPFRFPAIRLRTRSNNGSCGSIVFSIFWTLFSLFFLAAGVGGYLVQNNRYTRLTNEGKRVTGVVIDLEEDHDSDGGPNYYVRYRFSAPVNGRLQSIDSRQNVRSELYSRLKAGQKIPVVYVPADPNISNLADNLAPPPLTLLVCFGGMGGLFTLVGLALLVGSLSRVATRLKGWINPVTDAV